MSPGAELWMLIRDTLKADTAVMELVDSIFDKVPDNPWKAKRAYISRGPFYAVDDGADCIDGQEFTIQIDIWSRKTDRWSCDEIVEAVRKALDERDLQLSENALAGIRVGLTRVFDDPDELTIHGIVQVIARVEIPEGT
ncbi:DUF3168 domain-containing protein [Neorhizobium sp. Rsf11]|uniref:DUF3168 domain-containing protein n=1 Tax=Neorhizobium phenanthreniclasticum TaxID=3157917 RepID=A0ABV0LX74_9HYPH